MPKKMLKWPKILHRKGRLERGDDLLEKPDG
jgi:hypothetical protein